jgi:aldehyde dehydrogenase (NAD+)
VSEAIERPASGTPPWEYASAPESTDVVRLENRYGLFIGGEFVEPTSHRCFPTISPSI